MSDNAEIGTCPNCYAPLWLYPVMFDDDKVKTRCKYCDAVIDITAFIKGDEC